MTLGLLASRTHGTLSSSIMNGLLELRFRDTEQVWARKEIIVNENDNFDLFQSVKKASQDWELV